MRRGIQERRCVHFDSQLLKRLQELGIFDSAELIFSQISKQICIHMLETGRLRDFQIGGHAMAFDEVAVGR